MKRVKEKRERERDVEEHRKREKDNGENQFTYRLYPMREENSAINTHTRAHTHTSTHTII